MEKKQGVSIGFCAAIIGSCLSFTYPAFSKMRVLWYYPLEHRWALEVAPTGLAMDWYGRTLLALLVGAAAFVVTYFAVRKLKTLSPRTFTLWAAWAATACVLAMAVYTYQLALRSPSAEPIPSWYVPK